jgi:hypothetical protein
MIYKIFIRGGGGENIAGNVQTARVYPLESRACNALQVWRLGFSCAATQADMNSSCPCLLAGALLGSGELHANCGVDKPDDHLQTAEAETPTQRHFSVFYEFNSGNVP